MESSEHQPRIVFMRPAYTVAEFAEAVGLGETTIRKAIDDHELIARWPVRTKRIITAEDGYNWLSRLPTEAPAPRRYSPGGL